MFGSVPFAGTITERPTGMMSGGGRSWRPRRGCRTRVKLPGGSLPMIVRVSTPCPRRASAWARRAPPPPPEGLGVRDDDADLRAEANPVASRRGTRRPRPRESRRRPPRPASFHARHRHRGAARTRTRDSGRRRLCVARQQGSAHGPSPAPTMTCSVPAGTMEEVPGLERPFLTFDQQQRCSPGARGSPPGRWSSGVVHAGRLSGLKNTDVDSELGELRVAHALEAECSAPNAPSSQRASPRRCRTNQPSPFGARPFACLLDRSLRDHPRILPPDGRPRRAAHPPRRLGRLRHPLEPRARAGNRAPGQGLLGVRPARHGRPTRAASPSLDALDQIYHWTELIQSSPLAVERSVHAAIGGAYRSQRITTLELRFNPMKRNRGGERDLDHIILAAIRGLDRASLEYPQVRAGLILMMDRTFTARQNAIIVEKAIVWASRGVVGVDIAGPRPGGGRYDYRAGRSRWSRTRSRRPRRDDPRRRGGRRAWDATRSARSSRRCGPTGSATGSWPRAIRTRWVRSAMRRSRPRISSAMTGNLNFTASWRSAKPSDVPPRCRSHVCRARGAVLRSRRDRARR